MRPLVSVIIPTYKRSEMLERAIQSVLNQTYPLVQVIVVDDNNPDTDYREKTALKMMKYAVDKRVKYIQHPKNRNGAVARNTGIFEADGEIVTFLDDDDTYRPNKIEEQVNFLIKNPKYRAVYCGWNRDNKYVIPSIAGDLSYYILSGDQIIYTNVIMMWKLDAINCGAWDETFKRHQEASLLCRFFQKGGKIGSIPKVLVDFDISDRTNEAPTSEINEEQTIYFLNAFESIIEKIKQKNPNKAKAIFIHRYRGLLLHYLKKKNFKGAISFYFRYCLKYPISMPIAIFNYMRKRIWK